MIAEAPVPPLELVARVGHSEPDPLHAYREIGLRSREEILKLLPADWTFAGKRVLDFGCGAGRTLRHFLDEAHQGELHGCDVDGPSIAWLEENLSPPVQVFRNEESPPLPLEAGTFDLIWAISVFTHIADLWSDWLLELHRLLRADGLLVATILGPELSREWAKPAPGPRAVGDVGMSVLHHGRPWDLGGPAVFLSEWWIREHWGRAFEIELVREDGFVALPGWIGQGVVLARKRPVEITVEELERIDPTDARELAALRLNIRKLHHESRKLREAYESLAASVARE